MDAFFASVEQRDFPKLKGLPVAVGGSKDRRGVVAAASYEARSFGVRSAMSMGEAIRRCPHLQVRPVRFERYREVSAQIREIFAEVTDLVEPLSIDEAFLDVTRVCQEQAKTAARLAFDLKASIARTLSLTASVGVASNKFLAKVASDIRKPDGLTVVLPEEIQEFLDPLPVRKIWGVGPATAERMRQLGIFTISDLRKLSVEEAVREFGKSGFIYYRLARGRDDRPVEARDEIKSVSTETTFSQDCKDLEELSERLKKQVENVSQRCERGELSGFTVVLKVRYGDFTTVTRSQTYLEPTRAVEVIYERALNLLEKTDYHDRPLRLLGVGLTNLVSDDRPRQLFLFDLELDSEP